jgi:hypothetical protein
MIELEIYATGVRKLDKILALELEFNSVQGLRYKIDGNHDIVYLELEDAAISIPAIRSIFQNLGLDPRIVGSVPPALAIKGKTERLDHS